MYSCIEIVFKDIPSPQSAIAKEYLKRLLSFYKIKYLQGSCPEEINKAVNFFCPGENNHRIANISIDVSPFEKDSEHPVPYKKVAHQVFKIVERPVEIDDLEYLLLKQEILMAAIYSASKEIFVDIATSVTVNKFFIHKLRVVYNRRTREGKLQIFYYSLRIDEWTPSISYVI